MLYGIGFLRYAYFLILGMTFCLRLARWKYSSLLRCIK
jgi:hypothetical protein